MHDATCPLPHSPRHGHFNLLWWSFRLGCFEICLPYGRPIILSHCDINLQAEVAAIRGRHWLLCFGARRAACLRVYDWDSKCLEISCATAYEHKSRIYSLEMCLMCMCLISLSKECLACSEQKVSFLIWNHKWKRDRQNCPSQKGKAKWDPFP